MGEKGTSAEGAFQTNGRGKKGSRSMSIFAARSRDNPRFKVR